MAGDNGEPIRVALVDDQLLVREALSALLDETGSTKVVCSFKHGEGPLGRFVTNDPEAVIIGFDNQIGDPTRTVRQLAGEYPGLRLCALVGSDEPDRVFAALASGCTGAVSNGAELEVVIEALRSLKAGRPFVDPSLGGQLLAAEWSKRNGRDEKPNRSYGDSRPRHDRS